MKFPIPSLLLMMFRCHDLVKMGFYLSLQETTLSTMSESPKSPFWETSKWGPYFSGSELDSFVMTFSVFGVVFFNWASLPVVSYWAVTLLQFVILW